MFSKIAFALVGLMIVASVRAESVEERFLAGLRERHLYRLAEVHGMRQWARDDLSDRERAELAIGLALVYIEHAQAAPPEERAALWKKADDVCAALSADWPDNLRRQMVEVQRALASLARGQQAREEAVGTANEAAGYAEALTHLRSAIRQLGDTAEAVEKQLFAQRMRPSAVAKDSLSADELQSLLANISFQLARAQRQLGLCYPRQTADRDDALLQALQRLEPLVQQTEADELVWSARLEAAACQRELGKLQEAWERLIKWTADDPPADVATRIAAERVRLLLAGGRVEQAQKLAEQSVQAATAASGDLALAHLEASLAAWKAASRGNGRDQGTDKLTAEVAAIGRHHGPYWSRQAQLLVGRTLAQAAPTDNSDALLLAAKNLYLNGRAAEALAAYDRAIGLLEQSRQESAAFAAAMTAAAIERQAGQLADAAGRYRQLALRYPRQERAAEAHRLAILTVADLMRERTGDDLKPWADAYNDLLVEHLSHWPRGQAADEVRWWLGRMLAGRGEWAAGREELEKIVPSSPHFQAAVYLVVESYEHELEKLGRGDAQAPQRAQLLEDATNYLQPIVAATRARPPAEWTELERSAIVALAELELQYSDGLPTSAAEMLGRVARSVFKQPGDGEAVADAAWQQKRASLTIVALARIGKVEDARELLQWQAVNSPDGLVTTLTVLGEPSEAGGRSLSRDMAELMLEGFELLGRQADAGEPAVRQRLVVARAAALAGAGHRPEALAAYSELAQQSPDDGALQEGYAALLADTDSAGDLRSALAHFQKVEAHSRKGGPRWRRARQARIDILTQLGDHEEAEKLLRLTRLLYPDWDRRAE